MLIASFGEGTGDPIALTQSSGENKSLYTAGNIVAVIGLTGSLSSLLIPRPRESYLEALRIYNRSF